MATLDLNSYTNLPARTEAGERSRFETAEVATVAMGLNDKIRWFKMPQFATVKDSYLATDDLDSATALVIKLRITDGTTSKSLIAASVIGQTGGIDRPATATEADTLGFVTDSPDYWIETEVTTAAGGAVAGTMHVCVHYVVRAPRLN